MEIENPENKPGFSSLLEPVRSEQGIALVYTWEIYMEYTCG